MSDRMTGKEAPIKLMWNNSSGDGWILFDTSFNDWPDMTKVDMLQDFVGLLQQEYEEQLQMFLEEFDDEEDD